MTEQRKNFPDFYMTSYQPCPYIEGRMERKLFTHLTLDKPDFLIDNLLTGGFRRSQNIAYMPYCDGCQACVSVRILVNEFRLSKSLTRVWRRNQDLMSQHIEATPTSEQYTLFRDYIDARHLHGGMADMSVLDYTMMIEDSVVDTFLTEYRLQDDPKNPPGKTPQETGDRQKTSLLAAVLCDFLSDGISMVYSYFTPEMETRSLGTYMILETVEYARELGFPYVYLGYWIKESEKMNYKIRFQPQEHLTPEGWTR